MFQFREGRVISSSDIKRLLLESEDLGNDKIFISQQLFDSIGISKEEYDELMYATHNPTEAELESEVTSWMASEEKLNK